MFFIGKYMVLIKKMLQNDFFIQWLSYMNNTASLLVLGYRSYHWLLICVKSITGLRHAAKVIVAEIWSCSNCLRVVHVPCTFLITVTRNGVALLNCTISYTLFVAVIFFGWWWEVAFLFPSSGSYFSVSGLDSFFLHRNRSSCLK